MAQFEKWKITGASGIVLVVATLISVLTPDMEAAIRQMIRFTAVTSLLLFCAAFAASSLRALYRNSATAWLLRNRRYVGLSFALSHAFHLGFIVWLLIAFPEPAFSQLEATTVVGGGLAYIVILAMSITSFAGPRKAIGPTAWNRLHTYGGYYIWFIFLFSYLPRALEGWTFLSYSLLLLGVLALRIARAVQAKPA